MVDRVARSGPALVVVAHGVVGVARIGCGGD
jgi:hypothetical protein